MTRRGRRAGVRSTKEMDDQIAKSDKGNRPAVHQPDLLLFLLPTSATNKRKSERKHRRSQRQNDDDAGNDLKRSAGPSGRPVARTDSPPLCAALCRAITLRVRGQEIFDAMPGIGFRLEVSFLLEILYPEVANGYESCSCTDRVRRMIGRVGRDIAPGLPIFSPVISCSVAGATACHRKAEDPTLPFPIAVVTPGNPGPAREPAPRTEKSDQRRGVPPFAAISPTV